MSVYWGFGARRLPESLCAQRIKLIDYHAYVSNIAELHEPLRWTLSTDKNNSHKDGLPGFAGPDEGLLSIRELAVILQRHGVFVVNLLNFTGRTALGELERKVKLKHDHGQRSQNARNTVAGVKGGIEDEISKARQS